MPFEKPSPEDLPALASRFGLTLDDTQKEVYAALIDASSAAYDRVEELYAQTKPEPQGDRSYSEAGENPLAAWYVRTEIKGADSGPLAGKTVAIKDNVSVGGVPMMNGTVTVEGFVPSYDATVVQRLLDAGATITGKSVCESLCFSGASHTNDTGPVRNPWDTTRTTGGSSAGSGALVAAREVDIALGGDQGGSVRIPAAFCGIVGHKPTHGLVPYTGAFPIERTIDHLGPMTATVEDAAVMLGVLAGYDDGKDPRQPVGISPGDYVEEMNRAASGLKVGVVTEGFGIPDLSQPGVDEKVRETAQRLTEAGLTVEEVSIPEHRDAFAVWNVIATDGATVQMVEGNAYGYNVPGWYDPELMAYYGKRWREMPDKLSVTTKLVLLTGAQSLQTNFGSAYAMAQNLVPAIRQAYDDALARYDVLVMPTLPIVASEIPGPDADLGTQVARALEMIPNTAPFDVTGHPATSVPAGLVDGLPVGLMIIGRHFDDGTCLQVARVVEEQAGEFPAPPAK
ncbi:amidase [Epidermidibacterium keratini]|uniref:Amidase n=1 Tax=Epidermidibacterium keratini TaxID=1891644 RepID=A0A7L4YJP1_9ACTN|nr:amidase [Epidermidibacterium keratini]QHB99311.1 amidase [Epidermidibacterium keratini]